MREIKGEDFEAVLFALDVRISYASKRLVIMRVRDTPGISRFV